LLPQRRRTRANGPVGSLLGELPGLSHLGCAQ
jgi:hypothetical protein